MAKKKYITKQEGNKKNTDEYQKNNNVKRKKVNA